MLNHLKGLAAQKVGEVLSSDATLKVVGDPRVQKVMMRAINLRADAREVVERQVRGVAAALDLVTREDVANLKRTIRDLEDTVEELRDELADAQQDTPAPQNPAPAPAPVETKPKSKTRAATKTATKPARAKSKTTKKPAGKAKTTK